MTRTTEIHPDGFQPDSRRVRQPEFLSYLFFAGLIATTFLV
jgi:hypothetical protein